MLAVAVVYVIKLAVEQIGLPDRANFDLVANPGCAAAGNLFLLQTVGEFQAFVFDLEGFLVGLFRVE